MKKVLLFAACLALGAGAWAKDVKTMVVTTTPQMHCSGCENKIKNGLKFEKGIKDIQTSVPNQTVSVKYDADKTTQEALVKAFEKMGYAVKVLKAGETVEPKAAGSCGNMAE